MAGDLPDYEKRIIIVTEPGTYPAIVQVDLEQLLGLALKTPTIDNSIPTSIENPAIAYDPVNDRFKQYIENPALAYDPVNDRFKIDLAAVSVGVFNVNVDNFPSGFDVNNLPESIKILDKDGSNLLVIDSSGKIAINNTGFQVTNFPSSYNIRALTSSDVVTAVQATAANLNATVTQAAKDRTISSIDAISTPTQINITALNGNSSALTSLAAGNKCRLKFISIEHSADVDIGYRFGTTGDIYYLRTTKGVYASNLIGCNNQGVADANLYLYSSGATNVKGYFIYDTI